MNFRNQQPHSHPSSNSDSDSLENAKPVRPTDPNTLQQTPQPQKLTSPFSNNTQTKKDLGFDDIPTDEDDMENVRFRDIFRAWAKQSVKDSALETKIKEGAAKSKRFQALKNDLKWAMQADLDEPVKPVSKPAPINTQVQTPLRSPLQTPPAQPPAADSKTIDININFGALPKLPKLPRSQTLVSKLKGIRWSKRRTVIGTTAVAMVTVAVIAWQYIPGVIVQQNSDEQKVASEAMAQNPDYTTLLPSEKNINTLGGWHRISPPDRPAVYAYSDKIGDVPINVSQQPLPDNFRQNTSESIAELAKNYAATHKVTADSTTIYVGTSAQGPQSAILTKNDVLILIKSTQKIDDKDWASYVQSLK